MGKHDKGLRIDRRVVPNFAEGDLPTADYVADDLAPPAPPSIPAPANLALTTLLTRSSAAPMALIGATWDLFVNGYEADAFVVQAARDSTFTNVDKSLAALEESAAIEGVQTSTLYYVRVQAVYRSVVSPWSAIASITTPSDTTPPSAVTNVAWQWLGNGDLVVTWTAPTSENYKDAELRIYASSTKTLHLRTMYGRNGATYTAAMNRADTGGVPVASVYIEVYSRSYSNVLGLVALPPNQPSKAPPATPAGLTSSWAGDTGLAGAECVLRWDRQDDAIRYRLTIDGVAQVLDATTLAYPLAANTDAHGGIPDPSLTVSLVAIDGLGQVSPAATITAVNARPPATTLQIAGGFSLIAVTLTPSLAIDRKDYRIRVVKDGSTVAMQRSADHALTCDISPYGSGSYQVGVSVVDVFEQVSNETVSAAVALDPLTIADLRVDAGYDDDITTDQTALNTLKDTLLASGGVYYP